MNPIHRSLSFDRLRGLTAPVAGAVVLACAAALVATAPARADVSRIREKAVELEQKLNQQRYESEIRGDTPNSLRIYKDFAFLLKDSKVEEARKEKGDPHAPRLAEYLVEKAVGLELATYYDDLLKSEMEMTADLDGKPLTLAQFYVKLGSASDEAERRKIYSSMKPLVEHNNVFQNSIATRLVESYQAWGYPDFAAFVAEREGIDLDATVTVARDFLTESQALYDAMFEEISPRYLDKEARRAKFVDLDYLLEATPFSAGFPAAKRGDRLRSVFSGLGVDLNGFKDFRYDADARAGKTLHGGAYAIEVPTKVEVGSLPYGSPRDDDRALVNLSTALFYLKSKQTAFEPAYLLNDAATAAVAYLVRGIRDEAAWLEANSGLTPEQMGEYRRYQAFVRLLEARMLAATVAYETALYRGATDAEDQFKDLMREATGVRLTSADARRSLEFAQELSSPSRFLGMLAAASLRARLMSEHGADWFTGGKSAALFGGWWEQGGALTLDAVQGGSADSAALIESITHIQGE